MEKAPRSAPKGTTRIVIKSIQAPTLLPSSINTPIPKATAPQTAAIREWDMPKQGLPGFAHCLEHINKAGYTGKGYGDEEKHGKKAAQRHLGKDLGQGDKHQGRPAGGFNAEGEHGRHDS